MKIDDFIKECKERSEELNKEIQEDNSDRAGALTLAQTSVLCVLLSEFSEVIKEENTNLLRAMPCGCKEMGYNRAIDEFIVNKCERCKQLEAREKE